MVFQFSSIYITKTYHDGKPLPLGTFVLKRNFTHVHFSDKPKPLRIGPYKMLDRLTDVTYELLSQNGSTFHIHRNHLILYYPQEPLLYPHLRNFMRFLDCIYTDIPNSLIYANSDSSSYLSDTSSSDSSSLPPPNDTSQKEILNLIINYNNNHERITDFSFHPPKF